MLESATCYDLVICIISFRGKNDYFNSTALLKRNRTVERLSRRSAAPYPVINLASLHTCVTIVIPTRSLSY